MTRDQIDVLWQRALHESVKDGEQFTRYHFAALVAAAEREKVARWEIGSGYATGHGDTIEDLLVELEWQVREKEREECAKVCEAEASRRDADGAYERNAYIEVPQDGCDACAAAIRNRK